MNVDKALASASDDNSVRLWSVAEQKALAVLKGHTDRVTCVAFSVIGNLLASGSKDKSIFIWHSLSEDKKQWQVIWRIVANPALTMTGALIDGAKLSEQDHRIFKERGAEGKPKTFGSAFAIKGFFATSAGSLGALSSSATTSRPTTIVALAPMRTADGDIQNSAAKLFSAEKALEFTKRYHPDIVSYRLGMTNNQANCISVVFPDSPWDNNTKSFKDHLQQLVMLSTILKKPALFISKEPGADKHFVCGLVKNNDILFVNPLGRISYQDCYHTLAKLQQEKIINEIRLSCNALQKQSYEEELVSSGPITLELAINILEKFIQGRFDQFWATHLKVDEPKTHSVSGLTYYDFNIKMLLPILLIRLEKSSDKADYQNIIELIRQGHYEQLQLLPIQNAQNLGLYIEDYVNNCKETDAQVVFNRLIVGEGVNNIEQTREFKSLQAALNRQTQNRNTSSQQILPKNGFFSTKSTFSLPFKAGLPATTTSQSFEITILNAVESLQMAIQTSGEDIDPRAGFRFMSIFLQSVRKGTLQLLQASPRDYGIPLVWLTWLTDLFENNAILKSIIANPYNSSCLEVELLQVDFSVLMQKYATGGMSEKEDKSCLMM